MDQSPAAEPLARARALGAEIAAAADAIEAARRIPEPLLARLHDVASRIEARTPRRGYPAWRDLDWWRNRWWNWRDVQRFLGETALVDVRGLDAAALEARLLSDLEQLPQLFAKAAVKSIE